MRAGDLLADPPDALRMTAMFTELSSIGGMEIITRLSTGGMGEVLLARRRGVHGFEKLMALKVIRGDLVGYDEMRKMFLDEAKILSRLVHPAIAQMHDFGEDQGVLYLSMEYVPGIVLNKLLRKRRAPLPPSVAARIVIEVCRGLHAAHELEELDGSPLGIVHRDISPQNLMLTFDGRMKILDFGVAVIADREASTTASGVVKGKLAYAPPEQILGKKVDRRSDLYSLSVVFHELLTAKRLFGTPSGPLLDPKERLRAPKPSTVVPSVPKALDDLVMRGLANRRDRRFKTAQEMAIALEAWIAEAGGETVEEFTTRELGDVREAHRTWLHHVLSEEKAPAPKPEGPLSVETVREPDGATGTPDLSGLDADMLAALPRRRRFFLLGALVLIAFMAVRWFPAELDESGTRLWSRWMPQEIQEAAAKSRTLPKAKEELEEILPGFEALFEDGEEDLSSEETSLEDEDPDDVVEGQEASDEEAAVEEDPTEALTLPVTDVAPKSEIEASTKEAAEKSDTPPIPASVSAPAPIAKPDPPKKSVAPRRASPKKVTRAPRRSHSKKRKGRTGYLSIIARSGGTIYVGGLPFGRTPLRKRRITVGDHIVALRRPGDRRPRWTTRIRIHPGRHLQIRLR